MEEIILSLYALEGSLMGIRDHLTVDNIDFIREGIEEDLETLRDIIRFLDIRVGEE